MSEHSEAHALKISHIAFSRNENVILDDMNFSINAGELMQIDGANGSGKSTLLRILAGLLEPSHGHVQWHGQDAFGHGSDYQEQLMYLGHKNAIKDDLSPLENLEFIRQLKHSQTELGCLEALEKFRLADYGHTPIRRMSAGQKRKVSLARLMLVKTTVWLLDEPFTALDQAGKTILEAVIKTHIHGGGLVIFATHQAIEIEGCTVRHFHLN